MSREASLRDISRRLTVEARELRGVFLPGGFVNPAYASMLQRRVIKVEQIAGQLSRALYGKPVTRKPRR